jgi:hypothetical protein
MPSTWIRRLRKIFEENVFANWKYQLAALAAAVIIWAYVAGQQIMEISFAVPIRFQNVPTGSQLVGQKLSLAEVTLSGRRDRILSLHRSDVWVSLELSGLRNGRNIYLLSTRDVIAPPGIDVKDLTPHQLNIQLAPSPPAGAP